MRRIPPMSPNTSQTADLVQDAQAGSPTAASRLFERLYDELRAIAGRVAGRGGRGTLSPTVVLHEAWLKLQRAGGVSRVENRAHFLNLAARTMRQVVANHVRDRAAAKRGGDRDRERLTRALEVAADRGPVDAVELNDALESLERLDARQADIATLRLLGGRSAREIAVLLGVSPRTVEMDWRMAKAHLARALDVPAGEEP